MYNFLFVNIFLMIFNTYGYHMDQCNESCSSGQPGKNFNVGHYAQTVKPNFVIPAMFIGSIIDLNYCFILLSLTLTLPGGHRISMKQARPIGLIFLHTFHLIRMKFEVEMLQFKLDILRLLLTKI